MPRAGDLLCGHALRRNLLDRGDEQIPNFFKGAVARDFGIDREQTRIMFPAGKGRGAGGLLRFDERLV